MRTFIESQFNYCHLIWMCHSRDLNRKINKLHERALRAVYKDKHLTFEQILNRDGSFTMHERNLQKLAVEMYKVKHNLCPKPIQELFIPAIRGNHEWVLPKVRTVIKGPKTWKLVPIEIKNSKSLLAFQKKIKD